MLSVVKALWIAEQNESKTKQPGNHTGAFLQTAKVNRRIKKTTLNCYFTRRDRNLPVYVLTVTQHFNGDDVGTWTCYYPCAKLGKGPALQSVIRWRVEYSASHLTWHILAHASGVNTIWGPQAADSSPPGANRPLLLRTSAANRLVTALNRLTKP